MADNWNKMKNMASKAIGEKMKVRERHLRKGCIILGGGGNDMIQEDLLRRCQVQSGQLIIYGLLQCVDLLHLISQITVLEIKSYQKTI